MSLAIIWQADDRILIGVDTFARGKGPLFEASKAQLVPHLNCIVAGRGSAYMSRAVQILIMDAPATYPTFDAVLERGAELVNSAWRFSMGEALRGRADADAMVNQFQEIMLCGWSATQCRMVCQGYLQHANGFTQAGEIRGKGAAGWDKDAGDMPEPSTLEAMLEIASTIVKIGQAKNPGYPLGGRLLFHEITQHTVSISSHEIPRN